MDQQSIFIAVLQLLAGIGVFLVACEMMSANLESMSSSKLKQLFGKVSKNRLLGVGIGAGGTAVIQSSGATSVMIIGFVNAGIITLTQAATMIYGANIGTTITGQIVALGMFGGGGGISTTVIFSALTCLGAFMTAFAKEDSYKTLGGILTGFGMLFVGLSIMSGSMESFAELESVKMFLASINNAILLVIIGAILTAIIQSSSVMTSVAITMVVAGLISLNQGIFLTMGSNIGSCVVALMAGLTGSKNAKRTSLIHLMFNVCGVVVFLIVGEIITLVTGGITYGSLFQSFFPDAPQTQLAMFHTFFNVITVLLILPLTDWQVRLAYKMVPVSPEEMKQEEEKRLYYLSDNMLSTPAVAVSQVKNEIVNMAHIAMANFSQSLDMISSMDLSALELFRKNERELNFLQSEIVRYLVRLSAEKISEKDRRYIASAFHSVIDLERIGDYAENVIEYAEEMGRKGEHFSSSAVTEVQSLKILFHDQYEQVLKAYMEEDLDALKQVKILEDRIDEMTNQMADRHVIRLNNGQCSIDVGTQYLSLAANAERVGDHLYNVAKTITEYAKAS